MVLDQYPIPDLFVDEIVHLIGIVTVFTPVVTIFDFALGHDMSFLCQLFMIHSSKELINYRVSIIITIRSWHEISQRKKIALILWL
jgi:hypothetical protein